MQRQVQLLEEKYKDIAQLKNMKEQVEDLKKERVWAEVIETEKVVVKEIIVPQTTDYDFCLVAVFFS